MVPTGDSQLVSLDRSPYRAMIGVGGIGSGLLFALEGNHTLGRNESRAAHLLPVQDYCKLHIITHYVAALLAVEPSGSSFHILPVGKVGNDSEGLRLKREMAQIGMDTRYVDIVDGQPTLLSICYQYPDQSGGNITTSESAAACLKNHEVDRVIPLLESYDNRFIALAVPEVPLEVRHYFLQLATAYRAFRVASFTSGELLEPQTPEILSLVDLLAINEDEAVALIGRPFNLTDRQEFLEEFALRLTVSQPQINISFSAGKEGVFAYADKRWSHFPALPVKSVSTMGAGDALLAGILTALIRGIGLINRTSLSNVNASPTFGSAIDLGILLASYSVTSPHTIHPDTSMKSLLEFAGDLGVTFTDGFSQILTQGDLTLRKAL
jgi:sugar/nucleoside kinase (ribokinase family)